MGKRYFTQDELNELRKNPYVVKASMKSIKFPNDFKNFFWNKFIDRQSPRDVFIETGFNLDIINNERIYGFTNNMKRQAIRSEGFTSQRALNSWRPANVARSIEDKVRLQELEIKKLNQKLEFLKKHLVRGRIFSISTASKRRKKEYIQEQLTSPDNLITIAELCQIAGVSRSSYYNWLKTKQERNRREKQDRKDFQLILDAYNYRGYNKGSRSIYMRLKAHGQVINRKKIQRLMNKYSLFCPIRKANPYKRMQKATKASTYAKNRARRNWENFGPSKMIQTDITYLFYEKHKSKKAYLSAMKDACTHQILSYVLSDNLKESFVLETVDKLIKNHGSQLCKNVVCHSDQGVHYSTQEYAKKLKNIILKDQ